MTTGALPPMNTQLPKHFKLIDIMRGFCAVAVVIFHYQHFYYLDPEHVMNAETKITQPLYNQLSLFYNFGYAAVSMFWMISGFVFYHVYSTKEKTDLKHFAVHRFSRLYPLHFIAIFIVLILQLANVNFAGHFQIYKHTDIVHFFLNIFFVSGWSKSWESFNGPIWSVSIELIVYAAFFLYLYMNKYRIHIALFVILVAFIGFFTTKYALFQCFADFFIGIMVYRISLCCSTKSGRANLLLSGFAVILSISILLIMSNIHQLEKYIPEYSKHIVFAAILWALSAIEMNFGSQKLKSIHWVGDITYASYLMHVPLQLLILLVLDAIVKSRSVVSTIPFFLSYMVILIGFSYLTFISIEKPLQRYFNSRLLRRQAS